MFSYVKARVRKKHRFNLHTLHTLHGWARDSLLDLVVEHLAGPARGAGLGHAVRAVVAADTVTGDETLSLYASIAWRGTCLGTSDRSRKPRGSRTHMKLRFSFEKAGIDAKKPQF